MGVYRPLRVVLFVYECIRLLLMLGLYLFFADTAGLFPALPLAAANGLFLLMALFMMYSLEVYGLYAPLYLAGKLFFVAAARPWFSGVLAGLQGQVFFENLMFFERGNPWMVLGSVFFMFCGDLFSAGASALLVFRAKKEKRPEGGGM
ncbi:MAG: hypothetical protein LBK83_14055 [Treponema sp.]|jgi:hypothetical protein|nr:hypothetical protein [Treponema sp.]